MAAIVWDPHYNTGLSEVDEQHRALVALINELGTLLAAGDGSEERLQWVFRQLAEHSLRHFADEEQLMVEAGLDPRYRESHHRHHAAFAEQAMQMWQSRESMRHPADSIQGFLAAWLSFHILGEDQVMARQIARIRRGESPTAAYEAEAGQQDGATSALLQALQSLYQVLSLQNQDLIRGNAHLEAMVAERTRDLAAVNARLQAEQQELRNTLSKMEQTQSRLLQAEKMASIGQLAAGVAHEINNPIGFVTSNLGTLGTYVQRLLHLLDAMEEGRATEDMRREMDLDFLRQDIADLLRESQDGLDRVRKIVVSLKDFSHVDEAQWQMADLNKGMESTLSVVWNELKYKAEVVRDYGDLPLVRCMPAQLNQVFMNLLVNAAQSIDDHGHIAVRSGLDGAWVWVEVEDSGKGMTPEVQQRVFEPFFTTKPVGKGTGLGLSISYDIVHKHGGHFELESAPGKGSRFRLWLPVAGPATGSTREETAP
ncbi:hypothetical protein DLREEDagrD3_08080 [Denitratisoma sp. agr-D3]